MKTEPLSSRRLRRKPFVSVWWWVTGIVLSSLFLIPLVTMLLSTFKSRTELGMKPPTLLPRELTLDNWQRLFDPSAGLIQSTMNSAIVSLGTVALTVVVSALAGYGFGRFRFRGSGVLFFVVLAGLMVPFTVLLTPLLVVLRGMGLSNNLFGVMLVYTVYQLPFCIFIMRNAFSGIPNEIEEAALMDGCTRVGVFRRIFIPLVIPGIVTSAIFAFLNSWNEFLAALVLLTDQEKFTLPIMLAVRQVGKFGTVDWGLLDTGIVVSMIPCLLIFFLLQRYYVSGIFSGAAK
ncbi:carbohydrate ABC transporter permease [Glaciibacter superstes]|uniref:carbohydrate ABC transporter permease n=1 Tax=Glaciibacter superstes TaxID=501023 RepID=UPI0003B79636|nr:carbohydrate ABC transporter permease [Glaciibacter superstes]